MAHRRLLHLTLVLIAALLSACSSAPTATPSPTLAPTFTPILQTHIAARCGDISADDTLMVSHYSGVYDLETGEARYESEGQYFELSPDNRYVAVASQGVIDISTGEVLFPITPDEEHVDFFPRFSPDSTKVIGYDGVYAVPTGEHILSWNRENPAAFFSPDSRYVMLFGDGVYDLETGERYFATDTDYEFYDPHNTFTRDGSRLALKGDGFYDMTTGTLLVNLPGDFSFNADETMISTTFGGLYYTATGEPVVDAPSGFNMPALNPDSTLAAISNGDVLSEEDEQIGAVYDLATGEERFTYNSIYAEFSSSGAYLIAGRDGVYTVATGERLYELGENEGFTMHPTQDRYVIGGQGVYDLASRELIYSLTGTYATFSDDGTLLFTNNGVYDAANGALLFSGVATVYSNVDRSLIAVEISNGCDVYQVPPVTTAP
jgi:hypothetical protein